MLNHAIDNLTTAQEDAYLTTGLVAFTRCDFMGRRCHLGILDLTEFGDRRFGSVRDRDWLLAPRFNALCVKLSGKHVPWIEQGSDNVGVEYTGGCDVGAARLGVLIRNRIWANRARRMLAPVSVGRSRGTPQ